MTIRFLADYGQYKANDTVTLSAGEESTLISQNFATSNLTGGTAYNPALPDVPSYGLHVKTVSAAKFAQVQAAGVPSNINISYRVTETGVVWKWNILSAAFVAEGSGSSSAKTMRNVLKGVGHMVKDASILEMNSTCLVEAGDDIEYLDIPFMNATIVGADIVGTGIDITVGIAVRFPVNTTPRAQLFGGQPTIVVPSGTIQTGSDKVYVGCKKGDLFQIIVSQRSAGGVLKSGGNNSQDLRGVSLGEQCYYSVSQGTLTSPLAISGNISTAGGTTTANWTYRPFAGLALSNVPSILYITDSRGTKNTSNDLITGNTGSIGFPGRWLDKYTSHSYMGIGGDRLDYALTGSRALLDYMMTQKWFQYAWVALGYNDKAAAVSDATIIENAKLYRTKLLANGLQDVFFATQESRNTSTDSYATLANQTTATAMSAINTAQLAGDPRMPASRVFDIASIKQVGGKWRVNGAAFAYTTEGTHSTSLSNLEAASEADALYQSRLLQLIPEIASNSYPNRLASWTVAHTLVKEESGADFDNQNAVAIVPFTFPAFIRGFVAGFYVDNTNGVSITAPSGVTIQYGATVTAAAGTVTSTAVGSYMKLEYISPTKLMATTVIGTWA